MVSLGMKVAGMLYTHNHAVLLYTLIVMCVGFVSNDEYNYLRSRGYTHLFSILQIRTDARNKYSQMRQNLLLEMLSPKGIIHYLCC